MQSTETYQDVQSENPQTIPQLFVTRQEAAKSLRLCLTNIDRAIASGLLKAKRVNRRVLINYESLVEFAQSNHVIPVDPPVQRKEQTQVLRRALSHFRSQGFAL